MIGGLVKYTHLSGMARPRPKVEIGLITPRTAGAGRGRPPRRAAGGLDQELAIRFVKSQIYASKIVQSGLLARWQAHPEQAPSTARSLCRRLREVRNPVAAVHHLDALHHRALVPRPSGPARLSEPSAAPVARSRGGCGSHVRAPREVDAGFCRDPHKSSPLLFVSSSLLSSRSVGKKRRDPRDESADHGSVTLPLSSSAREASHGTTVSNLAH
jgi:hypothetical protein